MNKHHNDLTRGNPFLRVLQMTLPMIGGMFAISAFNMVDTLYVSRLGTKALAAMSFTFPVVMVIMSVALGLGLGVTTIISKTIGAGDSEKVKRLTTDSLILTVIITCTLALIGLIVAKPLFSLMGAEGEVLEMTLSYMNIWFCGVAVVFIPVVANHAIRGMGNMYIPSIIMIVSSVFNAILDPLFIFGLLGFPEMGISGAAVATIISRSIGMVASLLLIHYRYQLLSISLPSFKKLWESWRPLLHYGLPAIMSHMLMPLTFGFITWLIAGYGDHAVAAFGAGEKIQMLCYMVPIAMGSVLVPFVGQNHGAGKFERVKYAWKGSCYFGFIYGIICMTLTIYWGEWAARIFTTEPEVIVIIRNFLIIIFLGSGLQHVAVHSGFCLTAIGYPLTSSSFSVVRMLLLTIPLTFIGSKFIGLNGIFWGMTLANILIALVIVFWLLRVLNSQQHALPNN